MIGIGGYDIADPADRVFAFDYNSTGKLDHLVLYRPGAGTIWILRNTGGSFIPIFQSSGIGGYDLADPADRAFAFDYDRSGKLDHLVLYRPAFGTIWIPRNNGGAFTPVYQMGSPGSGIAGYDLAEPADRAFAFDYDSSGQAVLAGDEASYTVIITAMNGFNKTVAFSVANLPPGATATFESG